MKIAYYAYNSRIVVSKELSRNGFIEESKDVDKEAEDFRLRLLKVGIDVRDRDYHDVLFSDRVPRTDIYEEWCWHSYLCINPLNELPVLDDVDFKDSFSIETDVVNRIRMSDIMHTFDHCRRILFWFRQQPSKERYDCHNDHIQKLLDCYFRLYSVMDKVAKVLNDLAISNRLEVPLDNMYFDTISPDLKCNPNKFVRGIYGIQKDISYSSVDLKKGFVDPICSMRRVHLWPKDIRNFIDHKAVLLINPNEPLPRIDGVLAISAYDLEMENSKLLKWVREVLLNMQFAYYSCGLEKRGDIV